MGEIWLNIGCGDKQIPDERWTNIDARPGKGIDYVVDLNRCLLSRSGFEPDSVDLIYCCHVMEHFQLGRARALLQDFARVLKPQVGVLRVCVPDMEMLAYLMRERGTQLGRLRGLIWGGQTYEGNTHYTGWDYQELARDLRDCGFFNVAAYDPWDVMRPWVPPKFRDFSFMELDGECTSLNVEAIAK